MDRRYGDEFYEKESDKSLKFLTNCINIIENEGIKLDDIIDKFKSLKKYTNSNSREITLDKTQYNELFNLSQKIYFNWK
jgi:hypothetical protein